MRNKSFFMLLLGLVAFTTSSLGQAQFDPVRSTVKPVDIPISLVAYEYPATVFQVNQSMISRWYAAESESIRLSIPGLPSYWVYKVDVFSADFAVITSDGKRYQGKEFTGIHYQARDGVVGLSIYHDHITAVISANQTQYNFGPDPKDPKRYFLTNEKDLPNPFRCQVNDNAELDDTGTDRQNKAAPDGAASVSCKLINAYFEVDYHLFQQAGSVTGASNFTASVFNLVNKLYRAEKIALKLGQVFVWTSPDPYALMNNSQMVLLNFATNRPPSGLFQIQHFLSTRPAGMGGVAYTASLCHPTVSHGFTNIFFNYNQLPTYSWTIGAVTHEIGHNFSSKHTHWCGWLHPGGIRKRIDSCGTAEQYNGVICSGGQKYRKGTIMSYCNNSASAGIDFTLGFGPLPGDQIRAYVAASGCVPVVSSPFCDSLNPLPPPPPACVWEIASLGPCINGFQTVTATSSPAGCTGANPFPATQPCEMPQSCVENLQHYVNGSGKSCFKFRPKAGCTYTLAYCRYDSYTNILTMPPVGANPNACTIRNNMLNYSATTTELANGWIDREAKDQPWSGGRWYSIRVIASDGQVYMTFFYWP